MKFITKIKDCFIDFWYGRIVFKHWQIQTKLPKTRWIDADKRILYAMMSILDDFYKQAINTNIFDWENGPYYYHIRLELDKIKNWWDNYPERKKEIEDKLNEWTIFHKNGKDKKSKEEIHENGRILFEELNYLDNKLKKEEQEMLHKIIDLRDELFI